MQADDPPPPPSHSFMRLVRNVLTCLPSSSFCEALWHFVVPSMQSMLRTLQYSADRFLDVLVLYCGALKAVAGKHPQDTLQWPLSSTSVPRWMQPGKLPGPSCTVQLVCLTVVRPDAWARLQSWVTPTWAFVCLAAYLVWMLPVITSLGRYQWYLPNTRLYI